MSEGLITSVVSAVGGDLASLAPFAYGSSHGAQNTYQLRGGR